MNYSDIVTPEERQNAKSWLEQVLCALRHTEAPAAPMEIRCLKQGWGSLMIGQSVTGRSPICLNGMLYNYGLGMHAESEILVQLPLKAKRLTGLAGVNDEPDTRKHAKALVFSIEGGGNELWKSGEQRAESPPAEFDIEVAGLKELRLKVKGPVDWSHADWANLTVTLDDGSIVLVGPQAQQGHCFSFVYAGLSSKKFLYNWTLAEEKFPPNAGVQRYRITRTDPKTGLRVIVEIKEYLNFPVLEWVVRFKNTGADDTPIIEDIKSLDFVYPLGKDMNVFLNYHTGDYYSADGYEPHRVKLEPESPCALSECAFTPVGGRPTNKAWPYYNIECPQLKQGVIAVIGWLGQWASKFKRDENGLYLNGGQELTRFKLLPGEEVRTPLSVLMFWRGDRIRSQNLWRRWMIAHNLPRPGGKLPEPIMPAHTGLWFSEMTHATEENQKYFIGRYMEENIHLDYWWMDAGWYQCNGKWNNTGTWEVDSKRFPKGLRAVSDYVHKKGFKTIVWFEPERVVPTTWLDKNHPEWLLRVDNKDTWHESKLLNLGDPQALKWLIDHIDRIINEEGIDLYRQDFNFDPLPFWRANDTPDRQGLTEIRHVEGYLAYWDELQHRHPDMLIDSCASGGRRNDLETMRRSVPLHKTDYNYRDLPAKQAFHHSLALWLPYFGANVMPVEQVDIYAFRSAYALSLCIMYDVRQKNLDYNLLRKLAQEWRQIAKYFYGDYYPLTPYSRSEQQWIAWQFDRPDLNEGLVQVFRRIDSPFLSASFKLNGLERDETYRIIDLDAPENEKEFTGSALMATGLPVTLTDCPQAAVFIYRRMAGGAKRLRI